ncbi:uncharacterized protein PFL1_06843 [Pseudozyma flocculosa PF-1]|uniref:Related to GTPase-activating protein beta-chimerin n=1 Tax=Pseudozyma flocculosa TaxID=84751 RepID=A0A5C3FBL6_9BASI|nr:uncharacterized protein PFL1_06843 [Pseudozyma flocculosa PF-1]EPQ31318.1 hypothetical protein PFL1_06843 [Pseudozyma flocculosa PF-1]SPO41782.1 related to GTPase-activating protein beta-chimerin [Pseudozyma flocculosa]
MKSYSSPVAGEGAWMGGATTSSAAAAAAAAAAEGSTATGNLSAPASQLNSPAVADANNGASAHGSGLGLGPGLHPHQVAFGTSPGAHSDLSNEANYHGSSAQHSSPSLTDFSGGYQHPNHHLQHQPQPLPHQTQQHTATYPYQQQQHQHQHQQQHQQQAYRQSYGDDAADHGLQPSPYRMSANDNPESRPSLQSVRSVHHDPNSAATNAPQSPSSYVDTIGGGYGSAAVTPSAADTSTATSRSAGVGGTPGAMASSTSFADISHTGGTVGSNGMIHAPATLGGPVVGSSSAGGNGNGNGAVGSGGAAALGPPMDEIVPTSFDEGMLRALCDIDCGMPLLFDRIKQSMVSAREAATFLKKRAAIEEEYARNLTKLARSTLETYSMSDAKAGSYVGSWQSMMKTHEAVADNRIRFASKLTEMSDELNNLAREVDKSRKQTKETGQRLEKNLTDAEVGVEKARARFDATAEDLERLLLLKSGESTKGGELAPGGKRTLGKAIGKSGLLFKNKNPQQILKQEEEIRARTSNASDAFRKEVLSTQGIRQEYFNLQLPRILRSLKESAEEIDNGTQYHLARYAFLFESTLLNDGMAISPVGTDPSAATAVAPGLKAAVEAIDNRADFKSYLQNYQVVHGSSYRGPRREGPYEEGFLPSVMSPNAGTAGGSASKGAQARSAPTRPIFGVDLADQMARDGVDVPPILEKCAEAIEANGLTSMGIYRLSGTTSKVQRLKAKFNDDWETVQLADDAEAMGDINIVAGCLKLWFRELPEPLLTHDLYAGFIEAAKVENERLRHIRLHERVNELPDANYATLKFLMAHLDRIKSEEHHNQMSASNLAIVFGPTLLSPPPTGASSGGGGAGMDGSANGGAAGTAGGAGGGGGMHLQDMSFQCRAVETILEKYREIFVDEGEE